jgi:hypothetical protein
MAGGVQAHYGSICTSYIGGLANTFAINMVATNLAVRMLHAQWRVAPQALPAAPAPT